MIVEQCKEDPWPQYVSPIGVFSDDPDSGNPEYNRYREIYYVRLNNINFSMNREDMIKLRNMMNGVIGLEGKDEEEMVSYNRLMK